MIPWCRVCGCRHSPSSHCRGELQATGVEFPGWKVNVETPRGILAIGVLIAAWIMFRQQKQRELELKMSEES